MSQGSGYSGSVALAGLPLGPANSVLWSDGASNQWSTAPVVTSLRASTFIGVGTAAGIAQSGDWRWRQGGVIRGRNNVGTGDPLVLGWGVTAADRIDFGDTSVVSNVITVSGGGFYSFICGAQSKYAANANAAQFLGNNTVQLESAFLASARRVIALCLGTAITTTEMPANTGDEVVFLGNATTVPTANSVGGPLEYATGGAIVGRGTGGTVTTMAPA